LIVDDSGSASGSKSKKNGDTSVLVIALSITVSVLLVLGLLMTLIYVFNLRGAQKRASIDERRIEIMDVASKVVEIYNNNPNANADAAGHIPNEVPGQMIGAGEVAAPGVAHHPSRGRESTVVSSASQSQIQVEGEDANVKALLNAALGEFVIVGEDEDENGNENNNNRCATANAIASGNAANANGEVFLY
jgi:hypothetical protein